MEKKIFETKMKFWKQINFLKNGNFEKKHDICEKITKNEIFEKKTWYLWKKLQKMKFLKI